MAVNDSTSDVVHQYVGQEPSGQAFNSLVLDASNKPHNPMINAGAVVVSSLLKSNLKLPDRFDYVCTNTLQPFYPPPEYHFLQKRISVSCQTRSGQIERKMGLRYYT